MQTSAGRYRRTYETFVEPSCPCGDVWGLEFVNSSHRQSMLVLLAKKHPPPAFSTASSRSPAALRIRSCVQKNAAHSSTPFPRYLLSQKIFIACLCTSTKIASSFFPSHTTRPGKLTLDSNTNRCLLHQIHLIWRQPLRHRVAIFVCAFVSFCLLVSFVFPLP